MGTIIITDSCIDLSADYIKGSNLHVISFPYDLNNKGYMDDFGESLSYHDFYEEVRKGAMPKTSQITAYTFEQEFNRFLELGHSVIYIGFTSALSQTFNNAIFAKNEILEKTPRADLTIIDSHSASVGQGLVVYYACELLKQGKSKEEIIDWVENNKLKVNHCFIIDSLEHLKRGGRISPAAAAIGALLDVKPFLNVDDNGKLNIVKKIRGRKRAIKALLDELKEKAVNPEEQIIFVNHGDCLEEAEALKEAILKEVKVKDVIINYVGPIIGTHTGPGMLCLVFLGEKR